MIECFLQVSSLKIEPDYNIEKEKGERNRHVRAPYRESSALFEPIMGEEVPGLKVKISVHWKRQRGLQLVYG